MSRKTLACSGTVVAILWGASAAAALPPFQKPWMERYAGDQATAEFSETAQQAKCAVCHGVVPAKPAPLNDYGKAFKKYVNKQGYVALRGVPANQRTYIDDGLNRADKDRSPNGKTFGDMIRAGFIP